MSGYSWVSIIALFCYMFLLLTFATSKRTEKVIRSFVILMMIMILWTGGSFAMRMQIWPSVNFWHHTSVLGMMMVPSGYHLFVLHFLEEKNNYSRFIWMPLHLALFVFNCFTGLFIPEPLVLSNVGTAQFIYTYTWHIYLLLALLLPCLVQMVLIIKRHCKGNRIAFQQLRPIIIGILALLLGHLASTIPAFAGIPLDIVSGIVNVLFLFYALYSKHLFKITLLLSKANCLAVSLASGCVIGYFISPELLHLFAEKIGAEYTTTVIAVAVIIFIIIVAIYGAISFVLNAIFIRNEKQQQSRINQLSEEINHILSVSDILQDLTDVIQYSAKVESMAVFVHQIDGDYRVEHTTNPLDEKGFYLGADHPLVTYFKRNDSYITLREFTRTTLFRSLWEKEKKLFRDMHADCFVPLRSGEDLVGIVVLPERKDRLPYLESDLKIIQSIADICAPALKDACVYERAIDEARIDKLTGLINRKFFLELLDREFEQYKDTALALCLLNLDDFKLYNQLYGTQEGDIALTKVAGLLRSMLSDSCHAARIGGKEFALLLPGYDIYSAKLLTENLVAEIMDINKRNGGQVTRMLTVSAGICAAPYMASTAKELFRNSETAVYAVKRAGKNAVQIYSSEIFHQEEQQNTYRSGYGEHASTIFALTAAIDARDHYTFQHSQNVAYYATELAKEAGMDEDLVEIVKETALLHDIGKIGIREDILNKPGKLTQDEYEAMKMHVENAVNIIRYLPSLDYVIPAVLSHHERFDGKGYPKQLAGEEIPIVGRILCIADAFDAMTSVRTYKEAMTPDEAIKIIEHEAGKQFDPKLAMIFINLIKNSKLENRGQKPQEAEPVVE